MHVFRQISKSCKKILPKPNENSFVFTLRLQDQFPKISSKEVLIFKKNYILRRFQEYRYVTYHRINTKRILVFCHMRILNV